MAHLKFLTRALAGLSLVAGLATLSLAEEGGHLRVGAFRQDMTPDNYKQLTNLWGRAFEGVHDKIYARAIVLDTGVARCAIVSVDTVEVVNANPMLESISRAAGIPASHIIIAASHDHNSPMIALSNMGGMFNAGPGSGAWIARAGKDIVNAVLQAQAALQPARIGIGSGKSYINANSNQLYPQGWRLGTNPDGPVDRTVWVLRFENLSGEPIAFLMNYAVHAIVMGPENRQLTADLPGAVSHFVESRYQDKAVALWTMGPAGDQNPVYMTWEPSDYATMEDIKSVHKTFEPGFSLVDTLGQMVGEEVVRVAANIKPLSTTARIYGAEKSVSCPGRKSVSGQLGERAYQDAGPVNFRLGLLMINDIALATVSGEVFVGIYRHLKNESPYSNTLMITMGNGRVGYFVDDVSYTTPYWQSMNTGVKPGCAENTIVNGILEMMGKR